MNKFVVIGIILVVVIGLWLLSRKRPSKAAEEAAAAAVDPVKAKMADITGDSLYAVIPGELKPVIGADSWYVERDIFNILGWTEEQYLADWIATRAIPGSDMTAEQLYAHNYVPTVAAGIDTVRRNLLIDETGGSWEGGYLIPPPGWPGSATDYSNWLREQLDGAVVTSGTTLVEEVAAPIPYVPLEPSPAAAPMAPSTNLEDAIYEALDAVVVTPAPTPEEPDPAPVVVALPSIPDYMLEPAYAYAPLAPYVAPTPAATYDINAAIDAIVAQAAPDVYTAEQVRYLEMLAY